MAKGRRTREIKEEVKSIVLDNNGKPIFSFPESFGESFGSLFESKASVEFPARLSKNPLFYQGVRYQYQQIDKGILPFNYDSNSNLIDSRDIIELCQKAYFNVSILKNTIDTMTEFSNSEVFFKGGNEKSRKFFYNWFYHKIGGYNLTDKWFREWFRSGNIFVYRFDGKADASILRKISNVYGTEIKAADLNIPVRYIVMNPAGIYVENALSFINSIYQYRLGSYECLRIKKPITEEDKEFRNSLPPSILKLIDGGESMVIIPLDPEKTYCVFCKKQDYEPFSVPTFFPVLSDIDLKLTFKAVEKVLARTVEYVTLQIKIGTQENPNFPAMEAMKELMRNETLGRILVTSFDTTMEFIIPDINKVLGPGKYQQVNEDIANGLMDIFSSASSEKFSSTTLKVQMFVEKLKEARRAFLHQFLNPEIKRIAQELGFKTFPRAEMAELDLTNENLFHKVILQLAQLGLLTADETMQALKTSYLPTSEESLESQEIYKKLRDKGLYEPLVGAQKEEEGRPGGSSGIKQQTKKVSPTGTSKGEEGAEIYFDVNKIADVLKETNKIYGALEKEAKKYFKVKSLNETQKEAIRDIIPLVLANEEKENWEKVAKDYIVNPKIINQEKGIKIDKLMSQYDVSTFLASVLIHCER